MENLRCQHLEEKLKSYQVRSSPRERQTTEDENAPDVDLEDQAKEIEKYKQDIENLNKTLENLQVEKENLTGRIDEYEKHLDTLLDSDEDKDHILAESARRNVKFTAENVVLSRKINYLEV